MNLDAKVITLNSVPTWREKLGVVADSDFATLTTRVAALESSDDQNASAIAALQSQVATLETTVATLVSALASLRAQYSTLPLYCPDDGQLYLVGLTLVDGMVTFSDPVAAGSIPSTPIYCADDGLYYNVTVRLVDGAPTTELTPA